MLEPADELECVDSPTPHQCRHQAKRVTKSICQVRSLTNESIFSSATRISTEWISLLTTSLSTVNSGSSAECVEIASRKRPKNRGAAIRPKSTHSPKLTAVAILSTISLAKTVTSCSFGPRYPRCNLCRPSPLLSNDRPPLSLIRLVVFSRIRPRAL